MRQEKRNESTPAAGAMPSQAASTGRRVRWTPDTNKYAIYARYSTSAQHETSIERQVEICRAYIASVGGEVAAEYLDRAVSGGHANRRGLEEMEKDAKLGRFGGLVVENVDRLARDLGVLSTSYKKLLQIGISMYQPGRGQLSLTDIAIQGLMGDEGRRVMSERSQYARNVMAREGLFPTGPCFGYARVPGQPGVLVIDEEQAKVVRRIFDMRLNGLSARQICEILDAEGVTMLRGRPTAAGITGLLANERFAGRLVYGRHQTYRDRETGRKTVFQRPEKEWIRTEVPNVQIVDTETWERVKAIREKYRHGRNTGGGSASRYMLSGLVRCPKCDETMVATSGVHGPARYDCVRHIKDRTCTYVGSINIRNLENCVLDLVAERLDTPGFVEEYVDAYNEACARSDAMHADARESLERRVETLSRKMAASFDAALTSGFSNARLATLRIGLDADLTAAEAALAACPKRPPNARANRSRITALGTSMRGLKELTPFRPTDEAGKTLAAAIGALIERIDVKVTGFMSFDVVVRLKLGSLVDMGTLGAPSLEAFTLEGSYRRPDKSYGASAQAKFDAERFARGEFDLAPGDWALIDEHLAASPETPGRLPRKRAAVWATLYIAMTGAQWPGLPKAIGSASNLCEISRLLREDGTWARIAGALATRSPERFGGLLNSKLPPVRRRRVHARKAKRHTTSARLGL